MNLPNTLSVIRIILSPVFLFFFVSDEPYLIALSFFIYTFAAITDWYDGWYARKYGFKTNWGRFMDPLADKILTSSAFIGFFLLESKYPFLFGENKLIPVWVMVLIVIIRDLALTVARSAQELKGKEFRTSFISKTKTFVQMVFIFLFIAFYSAGSVFSEIRDFTNGFLYSEISYYLLILITVLTVLSGAAYIFESKAVPAEQ